MVASTGAQIAATARSAKGAPFAWGGANLVSGVDTGGFVRAVYAAHGIDLPHHPFNMVESGDDVPVNALRPGDLVFMAADGKQGHQVGVYLDRGKFAHAPGPGQPVKISSLTDSYYFNRFTGGRRVVSG